MGEGTTGSLKERRRDFIRAISRQPMSTSIIAAEALVVLHIALLGPGFGVLTVAGAVMLLGLFLMRQESYRYGARTIFTWQATAGILLFAGLLLPGVYATVVDASGSTLTVLVPPFSQDSVVMPSGETVPLGYGVADGVNRAWAMLAVVPAVWLLWTFLLNLYPTAVRNRWVNTPAILGTAAALLLAMWGPGLEASVFLIFAGFMVVGINFFVERFITLMGIVAILAVAAIFFVMLKDGLPFFFGNRDPLFFFTGNLWYPTGEPPLFGILPLAHGTLLVTLIAMLVGVPISIGAAIYMGEFARRREREILKPFIEILAGVPSVILGVFAMMFLAGVWSALFNTPFLLNAWNGGFILAVMLFPIVTSISEDAINAVPPQLREAAYALGATRWEVARMVVLPAAFSGIASAVLLGLARCIGETMAVLMATGNAKVLHFDIFQPVQTMTATIAIEMGEVPFGSLHYQALFMLGIILLVITVIINVIADRIISHYREVGY
jgi:phosphate ABC transporter permease protein PstC